MTKEDLLQRIQEDTPAAIRFYQQHASVELGLLRELAKEMERPGVAFFLASMPNTPTGVLEKLESRDEPDILQQLALNPNCLARMAKGLHAPARAVAARSRKLTLPLAMHLAEDPEVAVRVELAKNPVITAPVQLKLSQDAVPFVRSALLENRRLVDEFQIGLGDDVDTIVHLATLLMPKLSSSCMEIWSKEDEELAQLALARRRDLTSAAVERLTHSASPAVLLSLLECQQLSQEALMDFAMRGDEATILALLKREQPPAELQLAVWQNHSSSPVIREALAMLPELQDAVGLPLAQGADDTLWQKLASNLSEGLSETRRFLAENGNDALLKLLLANPRCHIPAVLDAIVLRGDPVVLCHLAARGIDCSGLSAAAKARLVQSPMPAVRALVLQDIHLNP